MPPLRFTPEEDSLLRSEFATANLARLSAQMNKTVSQIRGRAYYLGLKRAKRLPIDRFMDKVDKSTECWTWTGAIDPKNGYGRFGIDNGTVLPHRWYYEYVRGKIPHDLTIDHLCRNRACVNPDHLEPVTRTENVMRGNSLSAINARKALCPRGERYDRVYDNSRRCSACDKGKHWHKALLNAVDAGDVRMHSSGDLQIFKYSQQAVVNRTWTATTRRARGIVFTRDGQLVAQAFPKFFNLCEMPETQPEGLPHESFVAEEKIDGSLVLAFFYDGEWRTATMQSFSSEQAIKARELLGDSLIGQNISRTFVFEVIYPKLDNILNYGSREEVYLLSVFEHGGQELDRQACDHIAQKCGFPRPATYEVSREELREPNFPDNFEGWVVRFDNGLRVKIKDPRYVRAHKILSGATTKRVIEILRDPEMNIEQVAEGLSPAFRDALDDAVSLVRQTYNQVKGAARSHFDRMMVTEGLNGRKDIALWIQANVPARLQGCVFGLLDNKDISSTLWKLTEEKLGEEQNA